MDAPGPGRSAAGSACVCSGRLRCYGRLLCIAGRGRHGERCRSLRHRHGPCFAGLVYRHGHRRPCRHDVRRDLMPQRAARSTGLSVLNPCPTINICLSLGSSQNHTHRGPDPQKVIEWITRRLFQSGWIKAARISSPPRSQIRRPSWPTRTSLPSTTALAFRRHAGSGIGMEMSLDRLKTEKRPLPCLLVAVPWL